MKCTSILLGIALFALVAMPSVQAQVETPAEEPPVIPPDIAEALGGEGGLQSVVSFGLDILFVVVNGIIAFVLDVLFILVDIIFALLNGIIAAMLAVVLACWYSESLLGLVLAWCNAICGIFPILTWVGGYTSAVCCIMRYIPCCAYGPNCWNAFKVTGQILGI